MGRNAGPPPLPDIFQYDDHLRCLRDLHAAWGARDAGYSFGAFAKRAGIPYRTHLRMVLSGKRPLTRAFVPRYAKGFKLSEGETEYLGLLVDLSCATGEARRASVRREMRRLKHEREVQSIGIQEFEALNSRWYHGVTLTLSRRKGFRNDPRWLSQALGGRITPRQAAETLRFLTSRGYLRAKGSQWVATRSQMTRFRTENAGELDRATRVVHRLASQFYRVIEKPWISRIRMQKYYASRCVFLTAAQAEDLYRSMNQHLTGLLPAGNPAPGGNLYVAIMSLDPLTDFQSVDGQSASRPAGKR